MTKPADHPSQCLDDSRVGDYVARRAPDHDELERHVESCADCRGRVAARSDALAATAHSSDGEGAANVDEAYCSACGGSFSPDRALCPKDGARLTRLVARPDPLLGRVLDDRFEVRSPLGTGGMGTVYRGWQRSVDREVAIKVIHPRLAAHRSIAKRFLREARLASRLSQTNIVNVLDFGQTDDGTLYIAMELVRGRTLAEELGGRGLPLRRVTAIGLQLCDALEAAHGQDIVHRDLKPGNIILLDEPPGRDLIKILDFGLAKSLVAAATSDVTDSNAVLGTPLYMPPEQIEGRDADHRADLYALGCILFHMAAGRPPFVGATVNQIFAAHVGDAPPALPAAVPSLLADLIGQLLAKDPADRPSSAAEVRTRLDAAAPHAAFAARLPSSPVAFDVTDPAAAVRDRTVEPTAPASGRARDRTVEPTAPASGGASDRTVDPTAPAADRTVEPTAPASGGARPEAIAIPRSRRRGLVLVLAAFGALAAGGAGLVIVLGGEAPAARPVDELYPVASPDAAVVAVPDAALAAEEGEPAAPAPLDAGVRQRPRPPRPDGRAVAPDARPPDPRPPDAGIREPDVPFLPVGP